MPLKYISGIFWIMKNEQGTGYSMCIVQVWNSFLDNCTKFILVSWGGISGHNISRLKQVGKNIK